MITGLVVLASAVIGLIAWVFSSSESCNGDSVVHNDFIPIDTGPRVEIHTKRQQKKR